MARPLLTRESLDQAMLDAIDGMGRSISMPHAESSGDVLVAARASGLRVVDVVDTPELQPFAFAAFAQALGESGPRSVPSLFGTFEMPPRLANWLRREVAATIIGLASAAPVLVLVRAPATLDVVARTQLEALVHDTEGYPVVWVVGPEESPPEPPTAVGDPRDLSTAASRLLLLVATSAIALTMSDLVALSGLEPADATRAAAELVADGTLVAFRGRYALTSAALREGVTARTPPTVRRGLYRTTLNAVLRSDPPAPAIAELALACARPGDGTVARVLLTAMDALRDADPEAAADYGSVGVGLLAPSDETLLDWAWRLLPLLWQTSRVDDARRLAARIFSESGQTDAEARTLLWLARFEGSAERAVRFTESALALPELPADIHVQLLGVHIRLLSTLGRADDVDRLLPAALEEAVAVGDHESLSRLQTCDSIRHFYLGAYGAAARLAELAEESWRRSGASPAEWMPEIIWEPHLRAHLGEPRGALAHLDELLAELAGHSQAFAVRFLHAERSLILLTMGRLAEASDEVVLATSTTERLWSLPPSASDRLQAIAVSVRLKIALHRGDAGEFDEIRRLLSSSFAPPGSEAHHRLDWWRFLLDEAQGTDHFGVDPDRLTPVSWLDPSDEVLFVRALLARGHRGSAESLAAYAAQRIAMSESHPLAEAISSHLDGLVRSDPVALDAAGAAWRTLDRALLAAAATSDAASAWTGLGDPRGAVMQQHAHDEFVGLGAHREAWRIRGALRRLGHVVGAERQGVAGALTPAERRVVDRAVLGLTVGRIATELSLSPHTVTTHLRHVYAKLGVSSREELATWARRSPTSD